MSVPSAPVLNAFVSGQTTPTVAAKVSSVITNAVKPSHSQWFIHKKRPLSFQNTRTFNLDSRDPGGHRSLRRLH